MGQTRSCYIRHLSQPRNPPATVDTPVYRTIFIKIALLSSVSHLVQAPHEVAGAHDEEHVAGKPLEEGVQVVRRKDRLVLHREGPPLLLRYPLSDATAGVARPAAAAVTI